MNEFYAFTIGIHEKIVYFLIFILIFQIFMTKLGNFKLVKIAFPLYFGFLSALCFTGFILWATLGFKMNLIIILMAFVWSGILFFAIKSIKRLKRAQTPLNTVFMTKRAIFELLIYILFLEFL